jgi:hypothetical protein
MGTFSTAAKNTMVDAERTDCAYASLHDGDPGATGANEISGGSPAYARKSVTFNASASGSSALDSDVTFDVPASTTVQYVGYWDALTNGNFQGSDAVTNETFNNQGQYKLLSSGTTLSISDS